MHYTSLGRNRRVSADFHQFNFTRDRHECMHVFFLFHLDCVNTDGKVCEVDWEVLIRKSFEQSFSICFEMANSFSLLDRN